MIRYFNNSRVGIGGSRVEGDAAQESRHKIDMVKDEVHSIILNSGINPVFSWTPPAAVGSHAVEVNLVEDIFNLDRFDIGPINLLNFIDKAVEKYCSNRKPALVRMFNPFFYLGLALDTISDLPFIVIGIFGFNRQKMKMSAIGRLVKGILYLATVIAAFLTILNLLDLLDLLRQYVHKLLALIREINSALDSDSVK